MKINCPNCNQEYDIPDEYIGHKVECEKCGHKFITEEKILILKKTKKIKFSYKKSLIYIINISALIIVIIYLYNSVNNKFLKNSSDNINHSTNKTENINSLKIDSTIQKEISNFYTQYQFEANLEKHLINDLGKCAIANLDCKLINYIIDNFYIREIFGIKHHIFEINFLINCKFKAIFSSNNSISAISAIYLESISEANKKFCEKNIDIKQSKNSKEISATYIFDINYSGNALISFSKRGKYWDTIIDHSFFLLPKINSVELLNINTDSNHN